jgi:hypothetical protein
LRRPRGAKTETHLDAALEQQVDQCAHAESVELSAEEIADARLRDTERACGLRLVPAESLEARPKGDHEVGTELQAPGLVLRPAEVAPEVARRPEQRHGFLDRFLGCAFSAPARHAS